jgi:hypothetical protein
MTRGWDASAEAGNVCRQLTDGGGALRGTQNLCTLRAHDHIWSNTGSLLLT